MNLDQEDKVSTSDEKETGKKKLTRKEKKALKKAEKTKSIEQQEQKTTRTVPSQPPPAPSTPKKKTEPESEEVDAKLDPSPVPHIPPPTYTAWEKISPPARRRKQISNMESGFREVLGLVQSMRNNQEVLLDAFQKLPEAVDSVKKLADHSAQQSDLLKAMNESMHSGAAGDFNKTLSSMDQTTQLLLERAQRSEERLYSMLRRAQRRIAFMTLMVFLLFLGAAAAGMAVFFPQETKNFFGKFQKDESVVTETEIPDETEVPKENTAEEPAPLPESTGASPIDQPSDDKLPMETKENVKASATEVMIIEPIPLDEVKDLKEEIDTPEEIISGAEETMTEVPEAALEDTKVHTNAPEDL